MKAGNAEMLNGSGIPFGRIIRDARKRKNLSQEQLGAMVQVKKNAVGAWEAGRSRPDLSSIPELCRILDIPLNVFFGQKMGPARIWEERFLRLNIRNRKLILRQMDRLYQQQQEELPRASRKIISLFLNDAPASAGPVSVLGENGREKVYLALDRLSEQADELIRVNGDSMEPAFHDGDIVFLQYTDSLREGEIGIFVHDDSGYIKEYRKDGLYSLNPDYPPIRFPAGDPVRCVGRVLGKLQADQLATDEEMESAVNAL